MEEDVTVTMDENLSMVATIIATISFQNAINLPGGGVRSTSEDGYLKCSQILNGHLCPSMSCSLN